MPSPKFTLSSSQLQAFHAGDQRIFKIIFDEFQPRLYRFLWLKVRNIQQAEDLVQETFLRFWKARGQLRDESRVEVYLFRIAANLAADFFRQRTPSHAPLAAETGLWHALQTDESVHELEQLSQAVAAIVATLPEGPATAFLLSRYEDMTYERIAEVMGLSIKTVEKHIGKALRILREKLQGMGWRA